MEGLLMKCSKWKTILTTAAIVAALSANSTYGYPIEPTVPATCGNGVVDGPRGPWIAPEGYVPTLPATKYWINTPYDQALYFYNWNNGLPEDGDIVVLDENAGDIEWDVPVRLSELNMTDYQGTITITAPLLISDTPLGEVIEKCDDGNSIQTDGCLTTCQTEGVGDNITQIDLGEECDQHECNQGMREFDCSPSVYYATCKVVYKAGDQPCTETNTWNTTPGQYYVDHNGEGLDAALSSLLFSYKERVVICPGSYVGNFQVYRAQYADIVAFSPPTLNIPDVTPEKLTTENFSNNMDSMWDTELVSADGSTTLYLTTSGYANKIWPAYNRVSGLRLTGATNPVTNVWINSDQGYETGEPSAGLRLYCTESLVLDHIMTYGNYAGIFIKDTDPEWDFDTRISRLVAFNNVIGVRWKYGNGNTLEYSSIVDNYIGLQIIDAKLHLAKFNEFKGNTIAVTLSHERYGVYEANAGVALIYNNIYDGDLQDTCGQSCGRLYYNYLKSPHFLNHDPSGLPLDIMIPYVQDIDGCSFQ
jgi:cysteine-rich repeat protein